MASVSFLQHSFTPLLYTPSQSRSSSGSSTRLKISSSSAIEAAPEIRLEGTSSGATSWSFSLEEMMEAGVHFGHQARRWNPKMKPYIFTENKGIHILDLTQTARFLSEACDLVAGAASKGKQFLIVGTKYQAADIVASCAQKAQCHYVNHKWLGGMLTNWSTIETRLQRLKYLEEEKKGGYKRFQEKEAAVMERQLNQMKKNLGGIKYMANVPDIVIIVDQLKESIAVKECITLGIPTICLVDSNCDPDLADIPIPANDDSRSSISWILNKLTSAISEARIYNSKS